MHPLVKIKKYFDNIKMQGTTTKTTGGGMNLIPWSLLRYLRHVPRAQLRRYVDCRLTGCDESIVW